jgi:undecaprenyl-diphosphatase
MAMLATALFFFLCDIRQRNLNKPLTNFLHSFVVGIFQIVALLPGASRSGWTTGAGILCGYSRNEALRFSFLLALPALFGAIVFNIKDMISKTSYNGNLLAITLGFLVSFATSMLAIHFCLRYFQSHKLRGFAIYLALIGCIAIVSSF